MRRAGSGYPLIFSILWSAAVLLVCWLRDQPAEAASFLGNPVLNLGDSPLIPLWSAMTGVIALETLIDRMPNLFQRRSGWISMILASALVFGTNFNISSGILFALAIIAGTALLSLALDRGRGVMLATPNGLRGIFFVSGMAALIYQVAWQRKLIGMLGADGQSVTVIVAVFLGGLGIGAWLGDWLSARFSARLKGQQGVAVFCLIELGIGGFGAVSMQWIDWIGAQAANQVSTPILLASSALALFVPTTLMGMTLPVLVELLKEKVPEIHENVGKLYALNALGSAAAAFLTAILIFRMTGLVGATWVAAGMNALTALLVFVAMRSWKSTTLAVARSASADRTDRRGLTWQFAAAIAAITGYISISQEILIIRMISWSTAAAPWAFGLGVGMFLLGLGWGSYRLALGSGKNLAVEGEKIWIGNAATLAILVPLSILIGGATFAGAGALALAVTLGIAGFLGGRSLPLISGQILADAQGNRHFGSIYAFNIVGSVSGAVLTGYVLFDALSVAQCCVLLALLSLSMAYVFARIARNNTRLQWQFSAALWMTLVALPFYGVLFADWHSKLHDGGPIALSVVVETRAGIVAVEPSAEGDIVIGGGAYDGRFNVDPLLDSNIISRPYVTMALHPAPHRVLEIGLASGSWAKVILSFTAVEEMTSVEINRGYFDLIARNEIVRSIRSDPRARFVVADGRKWLRANPQPWDVIIINNSFHWREGATLLHSQEFMELARSRLKPDGILFLNTTGSHAIEATALKVFPEAYKVVNGIAAINGHLPPFSPDILGARLAQSTIFQSAGLNGARARDWAAGRMPERLEPGRYRACQVLTDDAMSAEWGKAKCAPQQ
jgi:predicted membrane-bound spermidine synthase